jgi:hypothetical protein
VPGGNDASTDVTLAIDQSPAPDATGKIALKDSTFARVGYGIRARRSGSPSSVSSSTRSNAYQALA